MTYTPTDWTDGVTPVNAALMDKIEQGIDDIDSRLTTIETVPQGAELTYEGDYVPATSYADGDVVVKDSVAYMCVGGPTTAAPDPAPWGAAQMAAATPTGATMFWFTETAPPGWLLLNGAAVSRTTYAALFALWGTRFGTGDGSTTFNLPDCQGRMPIGVGSHSDVSAIGNNDGVAANGRTPRHRHSVSDPTHGHGATSTVSDPTHAHAIYDPTHVHPQGASTGGGYTGAGGGAGVLDTYGLGGQVGTGIGIYGAATGVTVGTTVAGAATGVSVGPGGGPLDSPPFIAVNWIVKV